MNEQIDLQPLLANRWLRFLAYLIDMLPITIITTVVFYYYLGLDLTMEEYVANPEDLDARDAFIEQRDWISRISLSVWILYSAIMDSSPYQATVGKLVVKIKVVDEFGNRLTTEKSAIRNLSKIISFLVFSLGFMWILIDRKKQGWHDKIARTFIVDQPNFDKATNEGVASKEGE